MGTSGPPKGGHYARQKGHYHAPMLVEVSARAEGLRRQLAAFMDEHIYPNEPAFHRQKAEGDRWKPVPIVESLKPTARAALRAHGPRRRVRTRGLQLLRAGHRKHGSAGAVRDRGPAQALAGTAAG